VQIVTKQETPEELIWNALAALRIARMGGPQASELYRFAQNCLEQASELVEALQIAADVVGGDGHDDDGDDQ
jgi:hypothetical protein